MAVAARQEQELQVPDRPELQVQQELQDQPGLLDRPELQVQALRVHQEAQVLAPAPEALQDKFRLF